MSGDRGAEDNLPEIPPEQMSKGRRRTYELKCLQAALQKKNATIGEQAARINELQGELAALQEMSAEELAALREALASVHKMAHDRPTKNILPIIHGMTEPWHDHGSAIPMPTPKGGPRVPLTEDEPVLFGLRVLTTDSIPPTEIRLIHAGKEIARFVNVAPAPTDPKIEAIRERVADSTTLIAYDRACRERDAIRSALDDDEMARAALLHASQREQDCVVPREAAEEVLEAYRAKLREAAR